MRIRTGRHGRTTWRSGPRLKLALGLSAAATLAAATGAAACVNSGSGFPFGSGSASANLTRGAGTAQFGQDGWTRHHRQRGSIPTPTGPSATAVPTAPADTGQPTAPRTTVPTDPSNTTTPTAPADPSRPTAPRTTVPANPSSSAPATSAPSAPAPSNGMTADEVEVLRLTNEQRAANGCGPLTSNSTLLAVARAHSKDMAINNYFDHNSKNGQSPFDRMRAAGYRGNTMGENIAAGQQTPAAVMNAWMNSTGHRANILNCSFKEIGVGVYQGGSYGIYWTQDFGG